MSRATRRELMALSTDSPRIPIHSKNAGIARPVHAPVDYLARPPHRFPTSTHIGLWISILAMSSAQRMMYVTPRSWRRNPGKVTDMTADEARLALARSLLGHRADRPAEEVLSEVELAILGASIEDIAAVREIH